MPEGALYLNTLETQGLQLSTLMAELEESFQAINPHPDNTIEQIMYRSGQRSVVEYIKQKLEEN